MRRGTSEAGFTMMEVIVSLALATIITTVLMTIYFMAYRAFQYQMAFTDIQYAERAAMQMIIEDVMAAQQVEYLDDGNKMRLQIDNNYVSYYLQNNTVYRHGGAKMPVANCISSLSFQADSRPGWTNICMEAQQGEDPNRISCAVMPRMMINHDE